MGNSRLLTAPLTAAAGLLFVLGGLALGAVGWLLPGRPHVVAGALAPARGPADLERWRIATVRPPAGPPGRARNRPPRSVETASPADPGLWLDVAHAVLVFPVTLVTAVLTGVWWFAGLGAVTAALRNQYIPGSVRPRTLSWAVPSTTSR